MKSFIVLTLFIFAIKQPYEKQQYQLTAQNFKKKFRQIAGANR